MPPKKSLKAIAAEQKKKNTADAENIVEKLKRETLLSSGHSTDKPKKPSKEKTAESKKKYTSKAKEAPKPESKTQSASKEQDMHPITIINADSNAMENLDASNANVVSTNDHVRAVEHNKSTSTSQRTKLIESGASSSKASVSASKARRPGNSKIGSKIGDYQYEIDCHKVADSIDVTDLQRHLEKHLKVDGKKNNLDGTISIHCQGNKAVIKSNTYLPKKSLRFLSKKFLKKNWNIRVVSKNVHSYEYKYIGSL